MNGFDMLQNLNKKIKALTYVYKISVILNSYMNFKSTCPYWIILNVLKVITSSAQLDQCIKFP